MIFFFTHSTEYLHPKGFSRPVVESGYSHLTIVGVSLEKIMSIRKEWKKKSEEKKKGVKCRACAVRTLENPEAVQQIRNFTLVYVPSTSRAIVILQMRILFSSFLLRQPVIVNKTTKFVFFACIIPY